MLVYRQGSHLTRTYAAALAPVLGDVLEDAVSFARSGEPSRSDEEVALDGTWDAVVVGDDTTGLSVTFDAGSVSGSLGCAEFSGGYGRTGARLQYRSFLLDTPGCADEAFLGALTSAPYVRAPDPADPDTVHLLDGDDRLVVVLTRADGDGLSR